MHTITRILMVAILCGCIGQLTVVSAAPMDLLANLDPYRGQTPMEVEELRNKRQVVYSVRTDPLATGPAVKVYPSTMSGVGYPFPTMYYPRNANPYYANLGYTGILYG